MQAPSTEAVAIPAPQAVAIPVPAAPEQSIVKLWERVGQRIFARCKTLRPRLSWEGLAYGFLVAMVAWAMAASLYQSFVAR